MVDGGALWFQNLGAPDQTCRLPILTNVLLAAMMKVCLLGLLAVVAMQLHCWVFAAAWHGDGRHGYGAEPPTDDVPHLYANHGHPFHAQV
jgi:hypothetical protein